MLTDSFFVQGFTHQVCEDYAVHGGDYAIISDGCSSGTDTDFGARLLAKAAEEHIQDILRPNVFLQGVSTTTRTQQRTFPNLPDSCLTATLMALKAVDDDYRALTIGDGIVGGKCKDGTWVINVVEYPKSGPYYLKYQMFDEVDQWLEMFGGSYKVRTYMGDILCPEMEFPEWDDEDGPPTSENRLEKWSEILEISESVREFDLKQPYNEFWFSKEDFEFTFVCSDGPESFFIPVKTRRKKYNQPICVLDVLRVMMNFVTIRPAFAKLQANWVFRQDKKGTFKRKNWVNGDDVSVGIIHDR